MRENFIADWAFAIRNALEDTVEKNFPQMLHIWPILKGFDFEAYLWQETHIIFVLRDKLIGIPTGSSKPYKLNDPQAPNKNPTLENLTEWQHYFQKKFSLNFRDAAVIIPLKDSGKNIENDWALWNEIEKQLWYQQIKLIIASQFSYLVNNDLYSIPQEKREKLITELKKVNNDLYLIPQSKIENIKNIIYIKAPVTNLQIQQDSAQATQIISISENKYDNKLKEVIQSLKKSIDKFNLSEQQKHELRIDIQTIEIQMTSQKPKAKIIGECLASIKRILENAIGDSLAFGFLEKIKPFIL